MSNSRFSDGRIWPYAVGGAITLVFGFCVATIVVTSKADLQPSDAYMMKYQDADENANEFIKAKLLFDSKYNVKYITDSIDKDKVALKYKITDKAGKAIDDAKVTLAISRPETSKFNKIVKNPEVHNGIYTFNLDKLPKAGIWNFIAKIEIGSDYKFYNIKADTRKKEFKEY